MRLEKKATVASDLFRREKEIFSDGITVSARPEHASECELVVFEADAIVVEQIGHESDELIARARA